MPFAPTEFKIAAKTTCVARGGYAWGTSGLPKSPVWDIFGTPLDDWSTTKMQNMEEWPF